MTVHNNCLEPHRRVQNVRRLDPKSSRQLAGLKVAAYREISTPRGDLPSVT